MTPRRPGALLVDYGGTLVDESSFDREAGTALMLAHAVPRPSPATVAAIHERVARVTRDVGDRRDEFGIETPWPALTRLIYDPFGIGFDEPLAELELAFWDAAVETRPLPGVREALEAFRAAGIPMGIVSNTMFEARIIRHEIAKHGLAEFFPVLVASSEYGVRKPNRLLFEVAIAQLGVPAHDTWFVGDRLDVDVTGARGAGMTPLWIAPPGTPAGADVQPTDWPGVAAMLQAGEQAGTPARAP